MSNIKEAIQKAKEEMVDTFGNISGDALHAIEMINEDEWTSERLRCIESKIEVRLASIRNLIKAVGYLEREI